METLHQGIVTLLRSAVTGEALALPPDFRLEDADAIIRRQSLLPMAYQGAIHCGFTGEKALLAAYRTQNYRYLLRSEGQMKALGGLLRAFEEAGIDHMPLKGSRLKGLYPRPELRPMCDADILIRPEQLDRIGPVMEALGYAEGLKTDHDVCWKNAQLAVELHYRLFGPEEADLCRYFGDGWSRAVKGPGACWDMTAEDTYVYLFAHMVKHFRFSGIGARQAVDLYLYRRAHPELDGETVERAVAALGLEKFHRNILRLLAVWFEGRPGDPVTDRITAFIFAGGDFGSVKNRLYTQELRRSGTGPARWRAFLAEVFPPPEQLRLSYNLLYRHGWLWPLFYPVRWVDVLLHRRKNIGKKLGLIRKMSGETVDAHRQALRDMGLDMQ